MKMGIFRKVFNYTSLTIPIPLMLSAINILPIGSSYPKYFLAISSVMIKEFGFELELVGASPSKNFTEKTLKNVESTQ